MSKIDVLITEEEILNKIQELAEKINKDYVGKKVTVICTLKGAVMFTVDLIKKLNCVDQIDFIKASSYGSSTESSGQVNIKKDIDVLIEGKDILLIEDIVDTGITLKYLIEHLKNKNVSSFRTCTLLDKPERRKVEIKADYTGFEIENKFIVGYGLDYNEQYRNLPYIGILN